MAKDFYLPVHNCEYPETISEPTYLRARDPRPQTTDSQNTRCSARHHRSDHANGGGPPWPARHADDVRSGATVKSRVDRARSLAVAAAPRRAGIPQTRIRTPWVIRRSAALPTLQAYRAPLTSPPYRLKSYAMAIRPTCPPTGRTLPAKEMMPSCHTRPQDSFQRPI